MKFAGSKREAGNLIARARADGKTVGFVPTMGALHKGHTSLIEASSSEFSYTVVSIFVNPTQFGPDEDLGRYPRDLKRDLRIAEGAGASLVFAPSVEDMYPSGFTTFVEVKALGDVLCGASRPGHFRGVTTVVAKLLNIVRPDALYLGRKDAQQAIILSRLVRDLDLDVKVRVMRTVREPDGVALSSRNEYISSGQRACASRLFESLSKAGRLFEAGERDVRRIVAAARVILDGEPQIDVEYLEARDAESLAELSRVESRTLLALAARIGGTRLIDNIILDPGAGSFEA
ncbi:MAG TPA: pantoate--beta-alanine ligase [bacterium]|nr:pantoate--beta-alanine ligase [bacterium]